MYFLDTNICAYIINDRFPHLSKRFYDYDKIKIKLPSVVLYELRYGIEKSLKREKSLFNLQNFLAGLEVIPFDTRVAEFAGKIRADLERIGQLIGHYDILIAATALAHGGSVVTNNVREFSRVDGLIIEDWSVL